MLQSRITKESKLRIFNHSGMFRMGIRLNEGLRIIEISEILYCQSSSNYSIIHLKDGQTIMVSKTLKTIQSLLPSGVFCRIHQSYLIAIDSIVLISNKITLKGNIILPISAGKRRALMSMIGQRVIIL